MILWLAKWILSCHGPFFPTSIMFQLHSFKSKCKHYCDSYYMDAILYVCHIYTCIFNFCLVNICHSLHSYFLWIYIYDYLFLKLLKNSYDPVSSPWSYLPSGSCSIFTTSIRLNHNTLLPAFICPVMWNLEGFIKWTCVMKDYGEAVEFDRQFSCLHYVMALYVALWRLCILQVNQRVPLI